MARINEPIIYICQFTDFADANAKGFGANTPDTLTGLTATKLSGGTHTGYWCAKQLPKIDATLIYGSAATPNIRFVVARDKMNAGQKFLVLNNCSGDVMDDIRLSPMFAGAKFPWGVIADVPTGPIPYAYFGKTTYNSTTPTNFNTYPVGFYGKMPGTGWGYLQPLNSGQWNITNTPAPLNANLQAWNNLAVADGVEMEFMLSGTCGWAVLRPVTIDIATALFTRANHGLKIGDAVCIDGPLSPTYPTNLTKPAYISTHNTTFNGSIAGTTLTVSSGLIGAIVPGQVITGTGVAANTVIVSGAGSTWQVSISQTVTLRALIGTPTGIYYVVASGFTVNDLKIARQPGGTPIVLSGTQSGVFHLRKMTVGDADGNYGLYVDLFFPFLVPDTDQILIDFITHLTTDCPAIKHFYGFNEPASHGATSAKNAAKWNQFCGRIIRDNFPALSWWGNTLEPEFFTIPEPGRYYYDALDYDDRISQDRVCWHGYATNSKVVWDRGRKQVPLWFAFGLENLEIMQEEGGWLLDTSIGSDNDLRQAHVAKFYPLLWALGNKINIWYGLAGLFWGTLQNTNGVNDPAGVAHDTSRGWMLSCSGMRRPGVSWVTNTYWMDYNLSAGGIARFVWEEGGAGSPFATNYAFKTDVNNVKTAVVAGSVSLDVKGRPYWLTAA